MIASLLLAVAVSASAQTAPTPAGPACKTNEMTAAWEKISFALWLTDYTIPDSSPREATLTFAGCVVRDEYLGEPIEAQELRYYVSEDGKIGVIMTTDTQGESGATTLTLVTRQGNSGLANSAQLGTFGHHKAFYKGTGYDKVSIQDWRQGGKTIVKNVFVIPTGAVVKPSCDDAPTGNDCR